MFNVFLHRLIVVIFDAPQSERVHLITANTLLHAVGIQNVINVAWVHIVLNAWECTLETAPRSLDGTGLNEREL